MQLWNSYLLKLEKKLGKKAVEKWLRPLKIVKFDARNLYLETDDFFLANWFKEHMQKEVERDFYNTYHRKVHVHLNLTHFSCQEKPKKEIKQRHFFSSDHIDSHATFPLYVTGPNNVAFKLFSELTGYVTENEHFNKSTLSLGTYNPIYLFGPHHTGKSHLLMACAEALKSQGNSVLYVRAETFTEQVIRAFRNDAIHDFRKTYRSTDILIIDGVDLLYNKKATQEELFHTFNTLHTESKQIIFSATYPPQELEGIEPRLKSRFEWGITLPIKPLSINDLEIIIKKRTSLLGLSLSQEIISLLLEIFKNPTSLIHALDAIALRCETPPNSQQAIQIVLKDLIEKEKEQKLTKEIILKVVAHTFDLSCDDILSPSRYKEVVLPRQLAIYLCRKKLKTPYLQLARFFSRDHSTIIASIKRVNEGIKKGNQEILIPLNKLSNTLSFGNKC